MAFSTGETVTVRVVFHNWEEDEDGFGDPIDPETVSVEVDSAEVATWSGDATPSDDIDREGVGVFSYDFVSNTAGVFKVEIIGTFSDGSTSTASSTLAIDVDLEEVALGTNYEIVFTADLEPMLIDPEELQMFYPDVELVEVASLINRYSTEVKRIFKDAELPFIAYEYVRAAVECALFRTYGLGASGNIEGMTLGDLSIDYSAGRSSVRADRGSAITPCELAAALRQEMVRGTAGIKAVVTGTNYKRKIPKRHLRHAERRGF